MRRSVLLSSIALGAVTTGLGAAGTWADFDDSARSEDIDVGSGAFAEGADIRIAEPLPTGCPDDDEAYLDGREALPPIELSYNEDGSADGITPVSLRARSVCVRNFGAEAVTLGLSTEVLADDDPACSEEEATEAGETCGPDPTNGGSRPGELDDALTIATSALGGPGCLESATVADLRDGTTRILHAIPPPCDPIVAPGQTRNFFLRVSYDPGFGGRDAAQVARLAQTDHVRFRYVVGASPEVQP